MGARRIYFFGALGGLLFGYDTGVISGAILFTTKDLDLAPFLQGAIVSAPSAAQRSSCRCTSRRSRPRRSAGPSPRSTSSWWCAASSSPSL